MAARKVPIAGAPAWVKLTFGAVAQIMPTVRLQRSDNGRVVGYDNQHGHHHRHYFGVVAAVEFTSFDDIEDQFQTDWAALRSTA